MFVGIVELRGSDRGTVKSHIPPGSAVPTLAAIGPAPIPSSSGPRQICPTSVAGEDFASVIRNCIAELPPAGGIADATGLTGTLQSFSDPFASNTKPVQLLLGAVTITTTVSWQPNAGSQIVGSAPGSTFLNLADHANTDVVSIISANNVLLQNVTIDANRNNESGNSGCVRVLGSTSVTLTNLICSGGLTYGIYSERSDRFSLAQAAITSSGDRVMNFAAVWIRDSDQVNINKVQIHDIPAMGFRFDSTNTPSDVPPYYSLNVSGLDVRHSRTIGISVAECGQCTLSNVVSLGSGQGTPFDSNGIDLSSSVGITLSNFFLANNTGDGLTLDSAAFVTITNGTSQYNHNDGLGTADTWGSASNGSVTNFIGAFNGRNGIELNSVTNWTLDRILTKDNNQNGAGGSGITLGGGTGNFVFTCIESIDDQSHPTQSHGLWGLKSFATSVTGYLMQGNAYTNVPQLPPGSQISAAQSQMSACAPTITGNTQ